MATMKNAPGTSTRIDVKGKIKSAKKANTVPFALTLDFSKCSQDAILAMAVDAVIVKLQSQTRATYHAAGNMGKDKKTPIVAFDKIVAKNMSGVIDVNAAVVSKARAPGKSLMEKVASEFVKLSPEAKKAQLAYLAGLK